MIFGEKKSSGPSTQLPGNILSAKSWYGHPVSCDIHPEELCVSILVGEVDSQSSEITHMCKACADDHEVRKSNPHDEDYNPECEKCTSTSHVRPTRDPEEGSSGPVYYWCEGCRKSMNEYNSRGVEYEDDDYDPCERPSCAYDDDYWTSGDDDDLEDVGAIQWSDDQ